MTEDKPNVQTQRQHEQNNNKFRNKNVTKLVSWKGKNIFMTPVVKPVKKYLYMFVLQISSQKESIRTLRMCALTNT